MEDTVFFCFVFCFCFVLFCFFVQFYHKLTTIFAREIIFNYSILLLMYNNFTKMVLPSQTYLTCLSCSYIRMSHVRNSSGKRKKILYFGTFKSDLSKLSYVIENNLFGHVKS